MLPDRQAGRGVSVAVLRVPGKAGRHNLKLYTLRLQQITLAVRPLAFDELDHAHLLPVTHCAGRRTKGRGGFTFAVAGKDNNNPTLIRRCGNAGIDLLFQALLALLMTFITHCDIPGLRPGWASKVMPVFRRLSSPISHR